MRKNIGRISFFVVAINIILLLIYLVDKNDLTFDRNDNGEIVSEMVIMRDETVDGDYVQMLENLISEKKYDKEDLLTVKSYEWYLTDNLVVTDDYVIEDNEVSIYCGEDFKNSVEDVLADIVGGE